MHIHMEKLGLCKPASLTPIQSKVEVPVLSAIIKRQQFLFCPQVRQPCAMFVGVLKVINKCQQEEKLVWLASSCLLVCATSEM